ncbi:MAG: hypothetical protein RLY71_1085 [Pseudomonadota bacterium]|jgi:DNA-binding beta-propeller fold protein YncE
MNIKISRLATVLRQQNWQKIIRLAPVLACLTLAQGVRAAPPGDRLPYRDQVLQGGIRAELKLEGERSGPIPLGESLSLSLELQDETARTALRGLRPRLWVSRQTADPPEPCDALVRRFISGRLSQRADRDLNGFQLVTLNADNSISFINPLIQLNRTKLEALVPLPGPASDWLLLPERDVLLVSLPEQGEVAVVDTQKMRLIKRIALPGGRPGALVASRELGRAWVLTDQPARAVEIQLDRLEAGATLPLGKGPHRAVLGGSDGSRLLVANGGDATLSLLDLREQRLVSSPSLPGLISEVTYSARSGRFYAASQSGRIVVIEPERGRIDTSLDGPQGLSALRADPTGSVVLAVSPSASRVVAIDTARHKLLASGTTTIRADQIGYTARYAYLLGRDSAQVALLDLKSLAEGRLASSEVQIFQKPNGSIDAGPSAELMAPSPEGDGMLIAGQADNALYYYMEGMTGAQGSYQTYRRATRALTVINRSLQETAPGRYTGTLRLERGGHYRIPLLVQNPRVMHCFDIHIDETGATDTGRRFDLGFQVGGANPASAVQVGADTEIRLTLRDAHTGEPVRGVRDLQLMALEMPGLSQQRVFARETPTPGVYSVVLKFWRPGVWRLQAQSVSQGLSFDRSASTEVAVQDMAAAATTPAASAASAP